jgi:hypothetical protein
MKVQSFKPPNNPTKEEPFHATPMYVIYCRSKPNNHQLQTHNP